MAWGAQQWLRATLEATYGTFNGSASAGNIWWIRLPKGNAFTMRPDVSKTRKIIRSADGGNRRRQVVSGRVAFAGKLSTLFYPSEAAFFLSWASTLSSNDLPSYTLDYFDSVRTRRYLGCKIEQLKISAAAEQDYTTLDLDLMAQNNAGSDPTLTQPADTVFPTDLPYEHFESAGQITYTGSTVITKYKSWELTIKNHLAPTWDELAYITNLYYAGRDIDLAIDLQYVANTWRPFFEAQTALTINAGFARTGTGNTLNLNLETKNYVADLPNEDLPLDNAAYEHIGIQAFYDQGNTSDFAYTLT